MTSPRRVLILTPRELYRFFSLSLRPRGSLTTAERSELAKLVRRLLARKPSPPAQ